MNNNELKKIVDARARLIRLYGVLDGKHEPTATVLQADVAYEIEAIVRMIDNFLEGKVQFQ